MFFIFFYNLLNFGNRQIIIVAQVFDKLDLINIAFAVFSGIDSGFAGLAQQAFADIKVNGFFGDAGFFDEFADFHRSPGGSD